jgi:predicted NAD/FAD-binding protein
MLRDLLRFYREAPREVAALGSISLDDYLATRRYGTAFREDHLLPMAAAIWSTPAAEIGRYPAAAFIRFCDNHGLLRITGRPVWRTVEGGSRTYVARLTQRLGDRLHLGAPVRRIDRHLDHVEIVDGAGDTQRFDHVVIGTHADQALAMLDRPTPEERRLLGCFAYGRNEAVLHADPRLMPRRRRAWSSWNYISVRERLSLTYWMNRLQGIPETTPLFVTLNPVIEPDPALVHARETYEHPLFNEAAMNAQAALWSLQGRQRSWFCGAYFGSGFHEDGLQAGLAVAEQLGGVRRPWNVAQESSRIQLMPVAPGRIGVPA